VLVRARGADDLAALHDQIEKLYKEGKYPEAIEIAKSSLALAEKQLGADKNLWVAVFLNDLAKPYLAQGRYPEAETLMKRSLGIWEKALGPKHSVVAATFSVVDSSFSPRV
jgi:tetratricopeptide (TPR) repeat protein